MHLWAQKTWLALPKRTQYTDRKGQAYQAILTTLACTENFLSRTMVDGSMAHEDSIRGQTVPTGNMYRPEPQRLQESGSGYSSTFGFGEQKKMAETSSFTRATSQSVTQVSNMREADGHLLETVLIAKQVGCS